MVKIQNIRGNKNSKKVSDDERECQCGRNEGELQPEFGKVDGRFGWYIVCERCKTEHRGE